MISPIHPRQSTDTTDEFLDLIADPFQAEIQVNSIYAAIIWSFAVSGGLFLIFCVLRPRNSITYAPRAKYADERHKPRPLGRNLFGWISAVKSVKEEELVERVGLDAVVFLRFLKMLRNMFLVLTVFGCGILIPVNVVGGHSFYDQYDSIATLMKFTPQYIFGSKFWFFVAFSYLMQGTVCFFVWSNYRFIYNLRRAYFDSVDFKSSLHSRTLLLRHLSKSSRTDTGISELVEQMKQVEDIPRTTTGRNVKDLAKLVKKHDEAVRKLEHVLARYLRDPEKLPNKRPVCTVLKEDRHRYGKEYDAIDYLTDRISRLEVKVKQIRETVNSRSTEPYGFASYTHIADAHAVAYASRKKGPANCSIYLAPRPHDLIWQNLPMSRAARRARSFWGSLWTFIISLLFIVPNILTSVFLSDFSHLGLIWHSFQNSLQAHPVGWGIAQGILAPLVQTLMYMGVPVLFRYLYTHSGDISKTARERHVTSRLYAFTVFNNLVVFSVFGSVWRWVSAVIAAQDQGIWEAIKSAHPFSQIMAGLCNVSTFWLTWQMQRNLSAAIDIVQAWPLVWSFLQRKLFSPSPRQLIELIAPPPFEYADYYNNYLVVATVGLCFGALQPLVLPITAFYMGIDVWWKTYLLQYVFITKTESGGLFWKLLVNRLLFAVMLANAVIALIVGAQGVGSINSVGNGNMLYTMVPLPLLILAFKWYCIRAFDDKLSYYSTVPFSDIEGIASNDGPGPKRKSQVAVRFGHPALYRKLLTPMVHAKSSHLLKEVYAHRSDMDNDVFETLHHESMAGGMPTPSFRYSDMYASEPDQNQGEKSWGQTLPLVEVVAEGDLDFENFKKRAEFREEFGGDGELYGTFEDLITRPNTPSTMATLTEIELPSRGRQSSVPSTQDFRKTQNEAKQERDITAKDIEESAEVEIPESSLGIGDIISAGRN